MKATITKKELAKLVKIAQKSIPSLEGRDDLEQKWSDSADFFETAVWSLKDALIAAYELGQKSSKDRK